MGASFGMAMLKLATITTLCDYSLWQKLSIFCPLVLEVISL